MACPTLQETLPPMHHAGRINQWVQRAYWHGIEYCLSELKWVPKSMLDAGCGDGTFLAALGSFYRWSSLDAVEFDQQLLGAAQVCHPCRVNYKAIQDGDSLPYDDKQFDLVVSHAVVNFVINPEHWLTELARTSAEAVLISSISAPLIESVPTKHWTLNGRLSAFSALSGKLTETVMVQAGFKLVAACKPFPYRLQLFQLPQ